MNRPLPSRPGSAEPLDHDRRPSKLEPQPRHGEHGEQNMHRPRWARQEKSNLRVSDSVASPCCKLLISLNLARAWELAPIPQSCLAHVSSNPTRRDLSLPTLFNNERYPGALNSSHLVSAVAWPLRVRSSWSGLGLKADHLIMRPTSRGPCALRPMEAPLLSPGHRQGCIHSLYVITRYSSLLSVTGVGHVDVV